MSTTVFVQSSLNLDIHKKLHNSARRLSMTELLSAHSIELAVNKANSSEHIYIGYSGGVDSHVLLHLCASITHIKDKITAVYVHHGLQKEADTWANHCKKTADSLGVDFITLYVNAFAIQGESPEEAARNARYKAFKTLINVGDILLIAQHRDDQLETVLLQLFRGSGLRGLSGMPERMVFGLGEMLRPLLNISKYSVNTYAQAHALNWIIDPSNLSSDYDRNFLRNEVLYLLKQRWPVCDKTVARSAKHCADAQALISEHAEKLFLGVFNSVDKTLSINRLNTHNNNKQALIVRQWFESFNLKMPTQVFIERLLSEVVLASEDADPVLSGQGYLVRRYRDKLYCFKADKPEVVANIIWPAGEVSLKVSEYQTLCCELAPKGISLKQWQKSTITVKARSGGEVMRLYGRKGHHDLKKLFQEASVPPWERQSIPLIYLDDELAAVGDLWISADFYSDKVDGCIRIFTHREEGNAKSCRVNVHLPD